MTTTEALRSYFRQCRLLDWAFQVEESPEEPIVKRYTGGDAVWQKIFTLTSVDQFAEGQISSEHLQDWVEAQNRGRNLPELPDGKTAQRVECLEAGYLYTTADQPSRYQIKIRLTYYTGGKTR